MKKKETMKKSAGTKKKSKAEITQSLPDDAVALEDRPEGQEAFVDEDLVLEVAVPEADEADVVVEEDQEEVSTEVVADEGDKAPRIKGKEEVAVRLWSITGVSVDGKKVILGKYYTQEEAAPDLERIVADGFYHDVRVAPIAAPAQPQAQV